MIYIILLGGYLNIFIGAQLSDVSRLWVASLKPDEEGDISVEMISPADKGIYQSRWQLNTMAGIPFGGDFSLFYIDVYCSLSVFTKCNKSLLQYICIYIFFFLLQFSKNHSITESIWCIVTVDDMGILDITQKLASAPLDDFSSTSGTCLNSFSPAFIDNKNFELRKVCTALIKSNFPLKKFKICCFLQL